MGGRGGCLLTARSPWCLAWASFLLSREGGLTPEPLTLLAPAGPLLWAKKEAKMGTAIAQRSFQNG